MFLVRPKRTGSAGFSGSKVPKSLSQMISVPRWLRVDLPGIRAVMHAMMRRGIQNGLERPERTDQFRVDPELVEQAHGFHRHDHYRSEADDGQPQPENKKLPVIDQLQIICISYRTKLVLYDAFASE